MACQTFFLVLFCSLDVIFQDAHAIGINYGLNGNDLPDPSDAISLIRSSKITKVRLFEPNRDVLAALQGAPDIQVMLGVRNEDLPSIASDPSAAASWVKAHVLDYNPPVNILCIAAGNELPGNLAQYVPGAMQNLQNALNQSGIPIPVSTAVSMAVLSASDPPSKGQFGSDSGDYMSRVVSFLATNRNPLLVNAYTYFPRISFPQNIPLEYALLEDNSTTVVRDGPFTYTSLFEAMVDAVHAALEKAGGPDVDVVVAETGWPSGGNTDATIANAGAYNNNLVKRVRNGQGTPRRPNKPLDLYLFALFNENLKPQGSEQHWGLFYPNMTEVYHVQF